MVRESLTEKGDIQVTSPKGSGIQSYRYLGDNILGRGLCALEFEGAQVKCSKISKETSVIKQGEGSRVAGLSG